MRFPGLRLHLTMWALFSVSRDNLICKLVEENKVCVPVAGDGGGLSLLSHSPSLVLGNRLLIPQRALGKRVPLNKLYIQAVLLCVRN